MLALRISIERSILLIGRLCLLLICSYFIAGCSPGQPTSSEHSLNQEQLNVHFDREFDGDYDGLLNSLIDTKGPNVVDRISVENNIKIFLLELSDAENRIVYDVDSAIQSLSQAPILELDSNSYHVFDDVLVKPRDLLRIARKNRENLVFNRAIESVGYNDLPLFIDVYNSVVELNGLKFTGNTIPLDFSFQQLANKWKSDNIKYVIDKKGLSEQQVELISTTFRQAANDWQNETTVTIQPSNNPSEVNLEIIYIGQKILSEARCSDLSGEFAMMEHFDEFNSRSRIFLFSNFFRPGPFSQAGILRHELGHLFGFRHTCLHPKVPPHLQCDETTGTSLITSLSQLPYDSLSVMKGPIEACNFNDFELKISDNDKRVIREIY